MNEKTVRQMIRRLIFVSLCASLVFFGTLFLTGEGLRFYTRRIEDTIAVSNDIRKENVTTLTRSVEVPTSTMLTTKAMISPVIVTTMAREETTEVSEKDVLVLKKPIMEPVTEPAEEAQDVEITLASEVVEDTEEETKPEPETKPQEEETEKVEKEKVQYDGPVLTARMGINEDGPSGRESWYNLDMTGVVKIMKSLGYDYEYWIREDGVKMYGDYVMVAADLSFRPKGTILETSLGTAMVCDTGSFVKYHPYQLDIAVNW